MSTRRLPIHEFLAQISNALLIDVRSPAEYAQGHIPGAVNIPLFTNEERKVVGTAYKQESREKAIKIGLDYFGPKMRGIVEEVERVFDLRNTKYDGNTVLPDLSTPNFKLRIYLYCWRGGMRSGAIAWLLQLYGFEVMVLAGGYKTFRNYVLKSFEVPYSFNVLGGYTGSGKTEVLQSLAERGDRTVDLESLAGHKGSAFGNIGLPEQPTQEMFENSLALALKKVTESISSPIWIEDESQRIGRLNIPPALWKTLREAPVSFLEIPFGQRLQHLVEEYGNLDRSGLSNAIQRISKRLGGLQTNEALQHLESGNLEECFRILLTYYDKHYTKALYTRDNLEILLTRINCPVVSTENVRLLKPLPV